MAAKDGIKKKLNMKDDKHESKEFLNTMATRDFLHHITAPTRFTRSNEKQDGGGTTFQSG